MTLTIDQWSIMMTTMMIIMTIVMMMIIIDIMPRAMITMDVEKIEIEMTAIFWMDSAFALKSFFILLLFY